MKLSVQKRIAAQVLGCSPQNVVFDTAKLATIKDALTRADIRDLINSNIIWKATPNQQSRVRARQIATQKSKGLRKGVGSRKGTAKTRNDPKVQWMGKVRLFRALIVQLRDAQRIDASVYRQLYNKIKGNYFRTRKHILQYLQENNLFNKK